MEQLDDVRVTSTENEEEIEAVLSRAQHLRTSICQRPAHVRSATPQHFRATGPLHMAPPAVRMVRLAPTAPMPRPSAHVLANAAFLRRLQQHEPVRIWPDDIAERITSRSVWPDGLRSVSGGDVHDCLHKLLYSSGNGDAVLHRRTSMRPLYPTLPFWESRWSIYRQTLCKPVPIGIAAGLSAVLAIGQSTQDIASADVAVAVERSSDDTASRGVLRGEFVLTPAMIPTTTTTPAPTTTTIKPVATTAAKPKAKPPATAPATTSQCSSSKVAAHACWDGLLAQYSWNTTTAFNIMWCESHGNPNAKNPRSTATGLFQILNGPYDPAANVKLAYDMYAKRGWQPWVCKG